MDGSGVTVAVSCFAGNDGSAAVTMTGGVKPYTYLWINADTNATNANVTAGIYTVAVLDANGCTYLDTVTVIQPSQLTVSKKETPVSCFVGTAGSIDLTVSGGTPNYTFVWNTTATSEDLSGLTVGSYSVIITDDNGCTLNDTSVVRAPTIIVIDKVLSDLKCKDDMGGAIDLTISGGTSGYNVLWNNLATTEDISNLSAGSYSVIITDANNCQAHDTSIITEPDSLIGSITHTDINCFGDADATVDLTVVGGSKQYTYAWSNADTTQDLTGLSGGTYTVIITDSNSCMWLDTVQIAEPPVLVLALDSIAEVENNANGKAWVTVSGGVGPYKYVWNDPASSTTDTASNLSRGVYTVTVTDANSCDQTDSINVPSVLGTGGVIQPGDVQVYPNPNQGWVGIYNLDELGTEITLVLTDFRGRVVLQKAIGITDSYNLEIPRSMVDGTYFLSLYGTSTTVIKQIILMR
ncbi:MAG: hypothetical protein ACI9JN_000617 [Bacteroidia bacterium]